MKKYALIINEETKACEVGLGTNTSFYQSVGMREQEVEQAYDGSWYIQGFAPEKPQEVKEQEVRATRNSYLETSDKYMLIDFPISEEERAAYKEYREYLRDYPIQEEWWKAEPKTFEEWACTKENRDDKQ